jgi:hypothetical protein
MLAMEVYYLNYNYELKLGGGEKIKQYNNVEIALLTIM